MVGDVVTDDKNAKAFLFVVEAKHWKKIHTPTALPSNSIVYKIWSQVTRDAKIANKIPMGVIRENGMAKGEFKIVLDLRVSAILMHDFGLTPVSYGSTLYLFSSSDIMKVDYEKLKRKIKALYLPNNKSVYNE